MEIKITKKMHYENLIAYIQGEDTTISEMDLITFCEAQIADLDKKAAKAKARAAAKKAEGDVLTDLVYSVMTEEFQTGADIAAAVLAQLPEDTDVTTSKVTARITKLVNDGAVVKEQMSVEVGGKKSRKMAYRLNPEDGFQEAIED